MQIITLDGKSHEVKYQQNKEVISNDFGTAAYNYPDFVGSKLFHNSTSSDRYSLTFAIHKTKLVAFKDSIKKVVVNESDAIEHPTYGRLLHLIIEHPSWGAIKGNIVGSIVYETRSDADIVCKCTFIEHTPDTLIERKDIDDENADALSAIDTETSDSFDVDLSTKDKSLLVKLSEELTLLYTNIQDSDVISAFNDFNTELNEATLDSLRVMNAVKKILNLPNSVSPNLRSKFTLFQGQATAIKAIPVSSYNIALFNANALSFNTGASTRTAFVSESALEAAAGIKAVALN